MKVAVPVYGDSVSNVFDFARRLMLVELENGKASNRSDVVLESRWPSERAVQLKELGVDVLICGAISQEMAVMVSSAGIKILPFVTGSIADVLVAYSSGRLSRPEFRMPGCRVDSRAVVPFRGRRCRWRGGRTSE